MSRHVSVPSAFLALGLVSLGACVDAPPDEPPGDEHGPDDGHDHAHGEPDDGRIACGELGRVEVRDGKVVKDDMVFGYEDELAELCDPSAQDELFGIGYDTNLRKWPGGVVPYRVQSDVPTNLYTRIHQAISHWQAHTPIQFTTYIPGVHDDYVEFDTDTWCHAEVGRRGGKQYVWLTDAKAINDIRGVAIASNDWVYTWYADGSVTAGTSTSADAHRAVYKYTLPAGYTANQIVEIAIAADDRVYTWWSDGKVSIGTSSDLDAHQTPTGNFSVAQGKTRGMIVGIGIGPGDTVHAWYDDGTRSSGNSQNLGNTAVAITDVDIVPSTTLGVDFSSSGAVYTFYNKDNVYKRVVGTLSDQSTVEYASEKVTLPGDCPLSATIHEIGHSVGLKHEQSRCDRDSHVRVFLDNVTDGKEGNFDKECGVSFSDYGGYDFASIMHYTSYGFSKNQNPTLLRRGTLGANIPNAIEMAIASDDHVYTWWEDGTVTAGTSSELETYRSRYPFTISGTRTVANIKGIAIASDDRVYTYYDDGKVSVGTTSDLDAHVAPYSYWLAYKPSGVRYQPHEILSVGISEDDHVYVWYTDGRVSWGTSNYPGANDLYDFSSPLDPDRDEIKGIDISSDDRTYVWYETGRASQGATWNLSSIDTYDIRGRGIVLQSNSVLSAGDIAAVNAMY